MVFADDEHSRVPRDAKAKIDGENSPGARLYPAIVVITTKPVE